MDVSEPTPRVNFELLQRHLHKKVLLVGQIEGIQNDVARVRAADGGTVQVMTKPGGVFEGQYVQFEGIVESPTQLHELAHTSFGDSLGIQTFEWHHVCCAKAASLSTLVVAVWCRFGGVQRAVQNCQPGLPAVVFLTAL